MSVNSDFKDLFSIFNTEKVEYLIVGAHAVIFHAEPRYTKDIDIWINPTSANAARVWKSLQEFGAPLQNISENDFTVSFGNTTLNLFQMNLLTVITIQSQLAESSKRVRMI